MIKDFLDGVISYLSAVRHVSRHRLWAYVLLPGLLCVVIGFAVIFTAWNLSDETGDLIDNLWIWDWGREAIAAVSQVLGGLIVLLIGLIIFKQLIMVLLAPFMSHLSEKVENQILGKNNGGTVLSLRKIASDILRGLRIALRNIVRELSLTILLLLLGLIPVFTPFTTILIFTVQAYYAGFGNMDFTLERHYPYRESIKFVERNRWLATGNGAIFMLLLFSFVGFLFALPLSTVAATIETTKRLSRA